MLQILQQLQLVAEKHDFLLVLQFLEEPRNHHTVGTKVIGNLLVRKIDKGRTG